MRAGSCLPRNSSISGQKLAQVGLIRVAVLERVLDRLSSNEQRVLLLLKSGVPAVPPSNPRSSVARLAYRHRRPVLRLFLIRALVRGADPGADLGHIVVVELGFAWRLGRPADAAPSFAHYLWTNNARPELRASGSLGPLRCRRGAQQQRI